MSLFCIGIDSFLLRLPPDSFAVAVTDMLFIVVDIPFRVGLGAAASLMNEFALVQPDLFPPASCIHAEI